MNQHHQDLIVAALCERFVKEPRIIEAQFKKEATALIEAVALVTQQTELVSGIAPSVSVALDINKGLVEGL